MGFFSLEHGKVAYVADFVAYGVVVTTLVVWLFSLELSGARALQALARSGVGLLGWSAVEYAVHRFVLHGMPPFKRWHAEHHARPAALLGAPTPLSAALLAALLVVPAWLLGDPWRAGGLVLGMLAGYLAYAITHHVIHHVRASEKSWLRRRQVWHERHHQGKDPGCYGVTSGLWDQVFGTGRSSHEAPSPHMAAAVPHDPIPDRGV